MEDFYLDLQSNAKKNGLMIELIPSNRQSISELMPEFSKKNNTIQLKIQILKNSNEEIAKLTEIIHAAASTIKEKECMQKVEQYSQQSTKTIVELKKLFDELQQVIKESDPDEPETRAMIFNTKAIQQEVGDLLQNSQNVMHLYNKTVQNKMRRQLEILQPELNEKQKTDIINDPNGLEKLVMEQTLGQPSLQLVYRVQDIQDKYRDIQKLEKSAQHCFQMLSEIAFLVNQQGEQLESIEANLNKAQNYIKKGEKKLAEEKKIHGQSRKKMCCIILIGLIALGVIATPIILKFVNT